MSAAATNNDPNVRIPPAVLAAAQRADELLKSTIEQPTDTDESTEEVVEPAAEAPVVGATAEPPVTQPVTDDVNWEHRYNSMKGRHDALAAQIRDLQVEVQRLRADNERLKTSSPPSFTPGTKLITPEEETEFGTDFLNVVGKKAKEEVVPELAALRSKLEQFESKLGNVEIERKQSAHDQMITYLESNVPNVDVVNNDPKFLAWLQLPDPYSGATRQDMLNAAYERCNGPRVAAFFHGFLAEEAATSPASQQGAPMGAQAPKVPLEQFAAPGRAKTAAAQTPAEKPVFTRAEITAFYTEVAQGKWRGREADKDALDRAIHEATLEGRIR